MDTSLLLGQSEHLMMAMEAANSIGFWEWDINSRTFTVFSGLANLHSLSDFPATLPSFLKKIHSEDQERVRIFFDTPVSGHRLEPLEYRIQDLNDIVWLRSHGRVVKSNGIAVRILGLAQDVTTQKNSEQSLLKLELQFRDLSDHVEIVREQERTRIAREIHDEIAQMLTVIRTDLTLLNTTINNGAATEDKNKLLKNVDSVSRSIDQAILLIKRMIS